jgi:hypothetical protein
MLTPTFDKPRCLRGCLAVLGIVVERCPPPFLDTEHEHRKEPQSRTSVPFSGGISLLADFLNLISAFSGLGFEKLIAYPLSPKFEKLTLRRAATPWNTESCGEHPCFSTPEKLESL